LAAALARFEKFKSALSSELDLSSDSRTDSLARKLRDGQELPSSEVNP